MVDKFSNSIPSKDEAFNDEIILSSDVETPCLIQFRRSFYELAKLSCDRRQ